VLQLELHYVLIENSIFLIQQMMDILSVTQGTRYVIITNLEHMDGDKGTDSPFCHSKFVTMYLHFEQE